MDPAIALQVRSRIHELSRQPHLLQRLRGYAAHRLNCARAANAADVPADYDAEDLRQDAMLQVMLGTTGQDGGRVARPEHLADLSAFEQWLCGVMKSCLANVLAAARTRRQREAGLEIAGAGNVIEQVDARLLRARVVAQLRVQYAGKPEWLALVDQWGESASGAFPGGRHQAHALRQSVRRILADVDL
jgi:DNA-directed RNA polymerase specialized sigma24 family protein